MELTECPGRSLAILMIAWVSAAMVASILLRWKYMWIALAVLIVVFLIACGYAACTNYQVIDNQSICEETANIQQQHRRQNIQSICGDMNNLSGNCSHTIIEPPDYQAYWITDLPPSYASIITPMESSTSSMTIPPSEEIQLGRIEPRRSNPPPYSLLIQPGHSVIQPTSISQTIIDHCHYHHDDTGIIVPTNCTTISRSELIPQMSIVNSENKNETSIHEVYLEQIVSSNETRCLNNFISNRFGRGQRRQFDRNPSRTIVRDEHVSQCTIQQGTSNNPTD